MVTPSAPNGGTSISWPDFRDFQSRMRSLNGIALHRQSTFSIGNEKSPKLIWGELVSGNYFDVMRVKPLLGRVFVPEEQSDSLGAAPVAVISENLWRKQFRSDPNVIGTVVRVNRHPITVVGVAPADFRGSSSILKFDLWIPATMGPSMGSIASGAFTERGDRGAFLAICRLAQGYSVDQADAEARTVAADLKVAYPKSNQGVSATVAPPWKEHNGVNEYLRGPLLILLAVSMVVLLIVCANVANLLLARSVGRQREFAVRAALGAGRARVAIQVLMETLALALAGTVVGMLILFWLQGSLAAMAPNVGLPVHDNFVLNWRILGFTAIACAIVTILAGASPALFVLHTNLNEALKENSRNSGTGASRRMRNLLAASEVALATVALVGATLFIRSFHNARNVDPGFQSTKVLFGRFFIETAGYTGDEITRFATRLKNEVLSSSSVETVAYTDFVPLSGTGGPYSRVEVEGYVPNTGESMAVNRAMVGPDYFATMGIPLLEGREFTQRDDRASDQPVMIVNEAFAKRFFPNLDSPSVVGRKIRTNGKWTVVAGIARNHKLFSPVESPKPFFYLPFHQFYNGTPELYFLVRTRGAPTNYAPSFRAAIQAVDPNASAVHVVSLAEYTEVSTFGQRVAATLLGALGLVCLILASTGLYSVMSYTVSQRLQEIGIRMAMGATRKDILAMVVTQGMSIASAGMVAGAVVTLGLASWISSMLFGISPADPASFGAALLFLTAVTLLSTGLPAWRATRTDPVSALRR